MQENSKRRKDLKKTLSFNSQLSGLPLCCFRGVLIGDSRRRVAVQLSHKTALPDVSKRPRKCGHSRVFAVKAWPMATRFLEWPSLICSSGRRLLDSAFILSILRTRDNLEVSHQNSKLKRICSLYLYL